MVKYYYMGKRFNTPWQVFVEKVKRFLGLCVIGIVVAGVIVSIALIGRAINPKIIYEVKEKEVVLDNLASKIDQLKGELIKDIYDNERAGRTEEDALITWDPNPNHKSVEIASIGSCQWKIPTLQESYLKHYSITLTRKEAVLLALDDEKCKEVMTKVIFNEENGWRKWFNSGVKVKASERLAIIKSLEN